MSPPAASTLACAACGAAPRVDDPYPFRCPNADAGDGADHLLARTLDLARVAFPGAGEGAHPFVRYRTLLHSWHRARAGGLDDSTFVALVEDCDARVAAVDGHGMRVTPCTDTPILAARAGLVAGTPLHVKDETRGVAGSHKARHLFGLLLHLRVAEAAGWTTRAESDRRGLAIASCGNAALAAATLARADGRPLTAYIPPDADPGVVARLAALGATTVVCARGPDAAGEGDPCVLAFRRAVAAGALPFCCQGNENGLTVEGGMTLAWELVSAWGGRAPERVYVQVGGGALASACAQGLAEANALGALDQLPRLHAVQTAGAMPLARAYARVRERILARLGLPPASAAPTPAEDAALAERMRAFAASVAVSEELAFARAHRDRFMWPWETAPHSVAHGILDDETYDWHAVVAAMIASGGFPVTVGEERLREARDAGRAATGIAVDATGAAGLAGLLESRARGVHGAGESAAVLFTGGARA